MTKITIGTYLGSTSAQRRQMANDYTVVYGCVWMIGLLVSIGIVIYYAVTR